MASGHSTMSVTYKAVQTLIRELPEDIDQKEMAPKLSIDATGLVGAVATLYKALRQQASVLEMLEKEGSKRKMEYDITIRNLRNELEAQIEGEAKRRAADDEKLRVELMRLRADMDQRNEDVKQTMRETQLEVGRMVDSQGAQLRSLISELTQRCNQLHEEINIGAARHRDLSQKLSDTAATAEAQRKRIAVDVETLFQLMSVSRDEAAGAVRSGRVKELLLSTPVFRALSSYDRELDARIDALQKRLAQHESTMGLFEGRFQGVDRSVDNFKQLLEECRQELLRRVTDNHRSSMQRAQDLDDRKADKVLLEDKAQKDDLVETTERLTVVEQEFADHTKLSLEEREALARELQRKSDWEALAEKFDKSEAELQMQSLLQRVSELSDEVTELREAIKQARVAPVPVHHHHHTVETHHHDTEKPAEGKPDEARPDLGEVGLVTGLAEKLAQIDRDILALESSKVSRPELEELLQALRASIHSLPAPTQSAPQQGAPPRSPFDEDDATALRFRCLSCNRVAGNLFEQPRTVGGTHFPPSTMFLARGEKSPRAGARPASPRGAGGQAGHAVTAEPHAAPASRLGIRPGDATGGGRNTPPPSRPISPGGSVSNTRKKLMNYYDWLRGRGDEVAGRGQIDRPPGDTAMMSPHYGRGAPPAVAWQDGAGSPTARGQQRSPSPPGCWDGAQSGGGEPRTRQSGDHGSNAPHSIGSDGRYYAGVRSKDDSKERDRFFREAQAAQQEREDAAQKQRGSRAPTPSDEIPSRPGSATGHRKNEGPGRGATVVTAASARKR
eukprot:TRINITY_DN22495_c0_g1_i1.p1 TRINITY_DN22495_c0_g1~~TRINITY_DN22495_c0_g1_i1.p1  ORF type:complete len:834 (+),score=288.24 TRINITY_DN22495_c0_g1_i1:141-2504(+)